MGIIEKLGITKGPWVASSSVINYEEGRGCLLACVEGYCKRNDTNEDCNTARLIAAAPDMLEALIILIKPYPIFLQIRIFQTM